MSYPTALLAGQPVEIHASAMVEGTEYVLTDRGDAVPAHLLTWTFA